MPQAHRDYSPDPEADNHLLRIVHEAGGAVRDRYVGSRSRRFKNSADRDRTVVRLVAAGRLETFTVSPSGHGGRPALWLRIPGARGVSMSVTPEKTAIGEVMDMDMGGDRP
jgi:hypothetical protein